MCGILATNFGKLYQSIQCLKELEYRGYDSTGFVYVTKMGKVGTYKSAGNVNKLLLTCREDDVEVVAFMGHTRWATHGKATDNNAHPHFDISGRYAIVQNGIVENLGDLKKQYNLSDELKSDTDTEVIINIIASKCKELPLLDAIESTFQEIRGANACVILDTQEPSEFYMVEKGSSLNIHVNELDEGNPTGIIVSSNYIQDKDICLHGYTLGIGSDNKIVKICNDMKRHHRVSRVLKSDHVEEIPDKDFFTSYMSKEIHEQPTTFNRLLRGRIKNDKVFLGGLEEESIHHRWNKINLITMLACGSSLNASRIGQLYVEQFSRTRVYVEQAAEFRYRNPVLEREYDYDSHCSVDNGLKELFLFTSQSGETADTLQALKYVNENGYSNTIGICNVVGSTIADKTWSGIYTRAGLEIGVASTKAYTNQVGAMYLLGLFIAQNKGANVKEHIKELESIPDKIYKILEDEYITDHIWKACEWITDKESCLFLGRGYNYPTALEGALKMKEVSYIHAEGYSAAEMKHGPIALISDKVPTIAFANHNEQFEKIESNIREITARDGKVLLITDKRMDVDNIEQIVIPECSREASPILLNVVSQLLSLRTAELLGRDVDRPRNLAKSVTVE